MPVTRTFSCGNPVPALPGVLRMTVRPGVAFVWALIVVMGSDPCAWLLLGLLGLFLLQRVGSFAQMSRRAVF